MTHWAADAIFYHIYPLGFCGAPKRNDFNSSSVPRLEILYGWLDHLQSLGVNALYLGPLFESTAHGYDTADYYNVDRRLGTDETLAYLSAAIHHCGFRLILDGVFNHVGRNFWAFRDVLANRERSPYVSWFQNLSFDGQSPYHDPFRYEGWNGYYDLVKLNLQNPAVKKHLFGAVAHWMDDFRVDGLRLDAADSIDIDFLQELATFCRGLRPDFWLMGEVVHGDYRYWANPDMLDSVTNYECYKSLYSSHVDQNYFEIAYALNRQFGPGGIYRDLPLYAFVDNHDVNRIASQLKNSAHLYPLHCLLFTMPGVPSIYYGSEWGIEGKRNGNDYPLRPYLDLGYTAQTSPNRDLARTIMLLARIRQSSSALRSGDYTQILVDQQQFAFCRRTPDELAIIVVNAAERPIQLVLQIPGVDQGYVEDVLNPNDAFRIINGQLQLESVMPCWGRILINR